jgi:hypothetical protein
MLHHADRRSLYTQDPGMRPIVLLSEVESSSLQGSSLAIGCESCLSSKRGEIGIMHELRQKERSTVDRALSSPRVFPLQLHHNHLLSCLAMNYPNPSDTLTLAGSRGVDFGNRSRLFPPDPYHCPFLCVSRTLCGLHIALFQTR